MSTFRYYNIQVLPLETTSTRMIGATGYKLLFDVLWTRAKAAISQRVLDSVAYQLRHEMLFSPFRMLTTDDYAYGEFVKFDIAQEVKNLYTQEIEYEGGPGSTAHPFHFRFVFDFHKHILAIEDTKGRLPAPAQLVKALDFLLNNIAFENFPLHRLDITQLSCDEALDKVIESAYGFKKIDVDLTLSNSDESLDDFLEELLENNIQHVHHTERGEKGSHMHSPSSMGYTLLEAAKKFGNATISYLEKVGENIRSHTYHMRDFPVRISLPRLRDAKDEEGWDMIRSSIATADERAKRKIPRTKLKQ